MRGTGLWLCLACLPAHATLPGGVARAFHEALPLTGVILTKADGDARGGVALSVREVTGLPIKLVGTGEKIDALDSQAKCD